MQQTGSQPVTHVAITMDGIARWRTANDASTEDVCRQCTGAIYGIVRRSTVLAIPFVTLVDVSGQVFDAFCEAVRSGRFRECMAQGISNSLAGVDPDSRLVAPGADVPQPVREWFENGRTPSAANDQVCLTLVLGAACGRADILAATRSAAARVASGELAPGDVDERLLSLGLATGDRPDPDVIIRTGDNRRVGDTLVWQGAYAEFVFDEADWPDFEESRLDAALDVYLQRDRRFGGVEEKDHVGVIARTFRLKS